MSILKISDLRIRSNIDPVTYCWHWQGATDVSGHPRIYTLDHDRVEKRTLTGPRAVWNIAHGKTHGRTPYRRCGCKDCVNPVHMALAVSLQEMWAHLSRSGILKGQKTPSRSANALLGRIARGQVDTPDDVIIAIKNDLHSGSMTGVAIAEKHGVTTQTVSRIKTGKTKPWLVAQL
jgi:hypothetical protein